MTPESIIFNFEDIRVASQIIIQKYQQEWDTYNQLCLTHRPGETLHKVTAGIGLTMTSPTNYSVFNDEFKDTYFHHVWQTMNAEISICHMRLMRMLPHRSMSFHSDYEDRYHIAIETSPRAWIVLSDLEPYKIPEPVGVTMPNLSVFHVPADGRVYKLEAARYHTAVNTNKHERIHLVMCSTKSDYEYFNNGK